jgi:serine/threonine protein kinase
MSPEQTGRINRSIDFRTDFYSLGITFYKLISDSLPYLSVDAIDLINSHIAREPPPLPSHVPPILQQIIFKLMRYAISINN